MAKDNPVKSQNVPDSRLKLAKKPLHIAGGKPMSEAFLNVYFQVFSADQLLQFEKLYIKHQARCEKLGISGEEFMKMVRDAYSRYQELKKLDPFTPMDKKGEKYVIKFMEDTINTVYSKIEKNRAAAGRKSKAR